MIGFDAVALCIALETSAPCRVVGMTAKEVEAFKTAWHKRNPDRELVFLDGAGRSSTYSIDWRFPESGTKWKLKGKNSENWDNPIPHRL